MRRAYRTKAAGGQHAVNRHRHARRNHGRKARMGRDQPIQHLPHRFSGNLHHFDPIGKAAQARPQVNLNHGPLP